MFRVIFSAFLSIQKSYSGRVANFCEIDNIVPLYCPWGIAYLLLITQMCKNGISGTTVCCEVDTCHIQLLRFCSGATCYREILQAVPICPILLWRIDAILQLSFPQRAICSLRAVIALDCKVKRPFLSTFLLVLFYKEGVLWYVGSEQYFIHNTEGRTPKAVLHHLILQWCTYLLTIVYVYNAA